jgi:hypothetical protein
MDENKIWGQVIYLPLNRGIVISGTSLVLFGFGMSGPGWGLKLELAV